MEDKTPLTALPLHARYCDKNEFSRSPRFQVTEIQLIYLFTKIAEQDMLKIHIPEDWTTSTNQALHINAVANQSQSTS